MKESAFTKKFIQSMKVKFPFMYSLKVHGHEMQSSFIPDCLFCINGLFIGIEFKIQRDSRISITPGQIKELNKIKDSKGIALIIAYDENRGKILLCQRRLDYMTLFISNVDRKVKSKNIKLDWDFEFSNYEDSIDIISVLVNV